MNSEEQSEKALKSMEPTQSTFWSVTSTWTMAYVLSTEAEAMNLLRRTQASLAESNLRLHKFVSNSQAVLKAFPRKDCTVVMKDVDVSGETAPTQRSLGLLWEVTNDTFAFSVTNDTKPFTHRGVLSTVNSIFDPLGFLAPVTVQGRALFRELTAESSDWDAPLPEDKLIKWKAWQDSLQGLKHFHVPRTYTVTSPNKTMRIELCVFSDASTKAIQSGVPEDCTRG